MPEIPAPAEADLTALALTAPMMSGAEHPTSEALRALMPHRGTAHDLRHAARSRPAAATKLIRGPALQSAAAWSIIMPARQRSCRESASGRKR
jgi:hypothetical protein